MMRKTKLAVTSILAMALLAACDEASGIEISQAEFGDKWPFTVASGRLECVPPSKVIFHAGGTTYAVNGMASSDKRYREIRPIWKDNPEIPGTKINIGPIIDRGFALCK
jgi:Protein of unknown function (DUF2511)